MAGMLSLALNGFLLVLRTRRSLMLENLALRHQLAVLQRASPRPRLRISDRLLWVLLCWRHPASEGYPRVGSSPRSWRTSTSTRWTGCWSGQRRSHAGDSLTLLSRASSMGSRGFPLPCLLALAPAGLPPL